MILRLTRVSQWPQTLHYAIVRSPWGFWGMAMAHERVYACHYMGQSAEPSQHTLSENYVPANASQAQQMQAYLDAFIADAPNIEVPLALYGTPFQCEVWQALASVARGQTACYADLAQAIGKPKAAQAIGTAMRSNRLAPFLPCHRIVPRSGGLGNYYWGATLKAHLLAHEGVAHRQQHLEL